jgi:hypothetical protein
MKGSDSDRNELRKALTVSSDSDLGRRCLYCRAVLNGFERKRGYEKEFCSTSHRVKFWTFRRVLEDYREGEADGLKEMIEELRR